MIIVSSVFVRVPSRTQRKSLIERRPHELSIIPLMGYIMYLKMFGRLVCYHSLVSAVIPDDLLDFHADERAHFAL
jgi:hypothetical protein